MHKAQSKAFFDVYHNVRRLFEVVSVYGAWNDSPYLRGVANGVGVVLGVIGDNPHISLEAPPLYLFARTYDATVDADPAKILGITDFLKKYSFDAFGEISPGEEKILSDIIGLIEVQKNNLSDEPYIRGVYNGLVMAISLFTAKTPVYAPVPKKQGGAKEDVSAFPTRLRGFEVANGYADCEAVKIPTRKTAKSAGYDISVIEGATIAPGEVHLFSTGIKAYMQDDEYLEIVARSSIGGKKGLLLAQGKGVIDADYYGNVSNDGHILVPLRNVSNNTVEIKAGEAVAQGIFYKYLTVDNDDAGAVRVGGFGSTNK